MQNKLYNDYLELAENYFSTGKYAGKYWKKSFGCIVQKKHPWQRYIGLSANKLFRVNPLIWDDKVKVEGIGYLGEIVNEKCYVLFYAMNGIYFAKDNIGIGIIKKGGFPGECFTSNYAFGIANSCTNRYFWMDILLNAGYIEKLAKQVNRCYGNYTETIFDTRERGVGRLKYFIEKLEIGTGKPFMVDMFGKWEY